MKILIVEDEKRPREGLFSILTSMYPGVEILPPQKDGKSGIKAVKKELPDIIITDICMPDIDGLEMISSIVHDTYTPYIIIISGHSNFDYAQKALTLGVSEYLLKPYKIDDVSEKVEKALDKCVIKKIASLDALILPPSDGILFLRYHSSVNIPLFVKTIIGYVGKYTGNNLRINHIIDVQKQVLLCFYTYINKEIITRIPSIKEIAHRLSIDFKDGFVGFLGNSEQLLYASFSLVDLYASHMFYPHTQIDTIESLLKYTSKEITSSVEIHYDKNFGEPLYRGDQEMFYKGVLGWIDVVTHSGTTPKMCFKKLTSLLYKLHITLLSIHHHKEDILDVDLFMHSLNDVFCINQLTHFLQSLFPSKYEDNSNKGVMSGQTENVLVIKTLTFINQNIHSPLYLDEIADNLQVSREHLSRLFKEEMNTTFNSYVNRLKIDLAKNYIQLNTMDLYQIANKLGYSSSRYLSKVFKKITGMTIKEFKSNV